jgi:uncharacterized protein (DUF952 family)
MHYPATLYIHFGSACVVRKPFNRYDQGTSDLMVLTTKHTKENQTRSR